MNKFAETLKSYPVNISEETLESHLEISSVNISVETLESHFEVFPL